MCEEVRSRHINIACSVFPHGENVGAKLVLIGCDNVTGGMFLKHVFLHMFLKNVAHFS